MNPDINKKTILRIYSEEEYNDAANRLLEHKQGYIKFSPVLSNGLNGEIKSDLSLQRFSHNVFSQCSFQSAILNGTTGAGSSFYGVKFINTSICHAGFQNSIFDHCQFINSDLSSSSFFQSYITDTLWKECEMRSLNLSGAYIKNSSIDHCLSNPGNLSECCMDNLYIENMRLTNLNLEFSHFKKICTHDVILPFSQMPYIFGGLTYLITTDDNVRISSHINDRNSISIDEYIKVLEDMEILYSYRQEYFPLANILLTFGRNREAVEAVGAGLQQSARQYDFRMCKYYCKMITEYGNTSDEQLRELYNLLAEKIDVHSLTDVQYYQYSLFMPNIRSMLLENPNSFPHITIELQTDLLEIESDKLVSLYQNLDFLLHMEELSLKYPSITFKHNSPILVILSLCSDPVHVLMAGAVIMLAIAGVCKNYNQLAQAILNTQAIIKGHNEIKKGQLERTKLALEIQKLERENSKVFNNTKLSQETITASGITIIRADINSNDFNPYNWI